MLHIFPSKHCGFSSRIFVHHNCHRFVHKPTFSHYIPHLIISSSHLPLPHIIIIIISLLQFMNNPNNKHITVPYYINMLILAPIAGFILGVTPVGPIAGGLFATFQAWAGPYAAGSVLAVIQGICMAV